MACPFGKTVDGFETQFATNVLGHYLFTRLLIPRLLEGAPARVVSVSSSGHFMDSVDLDDINYDKRGYHPGAAYPVYSPHFFFFFFDSAQLWPI